ncbi:MAG TPA: hypothetical protein VHH55_10115 [Gaiellaceae bacterium]|jgi:hypothetical protein|nr:hypothetical protein [Gaiellaceae bacterium]
MAETREVRVREVKAHRTSSGNTRYALLDDEGNEYSTFREAIARSAVAAEGRRARIRFHEQERNGFTNVYLDAVEPLEEDDAEAPAAEREVEEAAWDAAIEAAPWLVGGDPKRKVPADQLFETLKPFKDRVAEDIKSDEDAP